MNLIINLLKLIVLLLLLSSCGAYQNSILFKTDGNVDNAKFKTAIGDAEKNYLVKKFDYLAVDVYTKAGEIIVDPENELLNNANVQQERIRQNSNMNIPAQPGINPNMFIYPRYLVNEDGSVYLPMIGSVKVEGLKMYQVDSVLSVKYNAFYTQSYVISRLLNRRVIIMGALGNKILTLENDDMSIIEVLSLAGNLDLNSRADRIRHIRNVLDEPIVQVINLTTWEGLKSANLRVEPNDIIYIEPRRRLGRREALGDLGSVVGIFASILGSISSVVTTVVLIRTLK